MVARQLNRLTRELRWRVYSEAKTRAWIDRKIGTSNASWCFILGVNNSGTTLLLDILCRHPEISGLRGEGQQLTTGLPRPSQYGVRLMWTEREDVFRRTEQAPPEPMLRALYDWSYYLSPKRYFLEKSPPNTIRSRWLQACFPNAHFIAITRSPYASCEGMRRRGGYEIDRAARHWVRANEILLEDWPHLERKVRVSYEDLCESCGSVLTTVQDFLQLKIPFVESEVAEMEFNVQNAEHMPAKLQNMNPRSLKRLSEVDIATIDEIAGPTMERLGYQRLSASGVIG